MQKGSEQLLLITSYNGVYQEDYKIPIHSLWRAVEGLPQPSYVMSSCKSAIEFVAVDATMALSSTSHDWVQYTSLGYSCILSVHISMHSWISSLCLACTLIIIKLIQSCILLYTYQAKMSLTLHKSEVDERWSRLFLVQPLSVVFSLCSLVPRPPQFLTSVCVQERA